MTQAELAEAAGISERTVSDLERGLRTSIYPATARRLADALDVSVAARAQFLVQAAGERGAAAGVSSARLPVPLTALIGREAELAALMEILQRPGTRLVTVVGPGGIGKTRLALAAAAAADIPASYVSLSAVDDPAQVMAAVAAALRVVHAGVDVEEALAERLRRQATLLLLDTFEHVVPAAAALARLLTACPGLTVLATSRSPLRVRGEQEFVVHPLAVQGSGPAVRLFLERARAAAPDLRLSEQDLEVVADICARLEGLPLAIELAAARARHAPIQELRRNLDHRLDHLTAGARDLPERHQTMRGTFDWSYALLGADEMRLFRALGVFRGGFDRGAAAAVSGTVDGDVLDRLVDSSLVVFDPSRGRHRLLDVGREYALERATSAGEVEDLRRRHAEHFLAAAERAEPQLRGERQREAFDALALDEANLRTAINWALAQGEGEIALRLCGALWMFWRWAGLFSEGRALLDAALETGTGVAPEVRCHALWGAGWLAFHAGDYRRTRELGEQMLELIGAAGDGLLVRNGLTLVGNAALGEGRTSDAVTALAAAHAACAPRAAGWHLATSLLNLGTAQLEARDLDDAARNLDAALAMYRDLGDRHFAARTLAQVGYLRLALGVPAAAIEPVREAMEIFAALGDSWSLAEGLEAVAAVRAEDAPAAVTLAAAAGRIRRDIGMRAHPPDARAVARRLARARELLTPKAFASSRSKGEALTIEAAVAAGLQSRSSRFSDGNDATAANRARRVSVSKLRR